eukprot:CAMPEP_0114254960 /NCGR_PEP_ID=MMETSP0058-20121206/17290_1 /TAXON_ID=36894 /ORGANISM="Pyramimonas parkeae, CCMP726" /LENGTH=227 /DNA_ID=CAMNT_0001369279 /DNA_START=115 /DNA_END=795 /DNA_ORIENTATION=-
MRTSYTTTALCLFLNFSFKSVTSKTIEDRPEYQACLADPATCESLIVWRDQLTGTIPSEMGNLTQLTFMSIFNNQLTGTVPTELGSLTRIHSIGLDINQLTGTIPTEFGALTLLKIMHIQRNQLSGSIPSEMAALSRLTSTLLCDNPGLCGDLPTGMTPNRNSAVWACPAGATVGTLLGTACPSSAPSVSPSSSLTTTPTSDTPLKDNWFRKRDVARKNAFPQKQAW